jgi:hypothetical protein
MTQVELAKALGLTPARVSVLARRGMPTHDVEAARAWRRQHVAPYVMTAKSAPPAGTPPGGTRPTLDSVTQQINAGGTPPCVDVLEALQAECVILRHAKALQIARTLGAAAHDALQAGRPIDALADALVALMREFPPPLLAQPLLTADVWQALRAAKVKAGA